ncbi:MAG: hypothetical protein ACJ74Q_15065 [Pyrinomonadaceae bacterium]
MRQFPTARARARAIADLLGAFLGRAEEDASSRIGELFAEFPHFWCAADEDVSLRGRLHVITFGLTGEENSAINLADAIIRDQAGLPRREDDTDPVFEAYGTSGGMTYTEGGESYVVVGPCPSASFRHAVVMREKDSSLKIVRWSGVKDLLTAAEAYA